MTGSLEASGRSLRAGARRMTAFFLALAIWGCGAPEAPPSLTLVTVSTPLDEEALQTELDSLGRSLGGLNLRVRGVPPRVLEETVLAFNPQSNSARWDLAVVPSTWLLRLHQRQAILEVPMSHVQKLQQAVSALALLATSPQGKTLGYPFSVDIPALYLNPRFFPQIPTSLQALAATRLPAGVLPLGLDLRSPSQIFLWLPPAEATETTLTQTAARQTLNRLATVLAPALAFPESFPLWTVSSAQSVQAQLFAEGKLAAFVAGAQFVGLLETLKVPYRVTPLPPLCEGCDPPRPRARVTAVVVNSFCHYPDLAEKVALELALPERNLRLNSARHTLPVLGSGEESQILARNPGLLGFQRALVSASVATLDEAGEPWQAWELALADFLRQRAQVQSPAAEVRR